MFDPSGDETRYAPAEQVHQERSVLAFRSVSAHEKDGVAEHEVVYLGRSSGLATQVDDGCPRLDEAP